MQLLRYFKERREDLKELWATGGLMGPSMEETVIRNAAAQGAVSILEEMLNLDAQAFNTEES